MIRPTQLSICNQMQYNIKQDYESIASNTEVPNRLIYHQTLVSDIVKVSWPFKYTVFRTDALSLQYFYLHEIVRPFFILFHLKNEQLTERQMEAKPTIPSGRKW